MKTKTRTITVFVADDGREFKTRGGCLAYERKAGVSERECIQRCQACQSTLYFAHDKSSWAMRSYLERKKRLHETIQDGGVLRGVERHAQLRDAWDAKVWGWRSLQEANLELKEAKARYCEALEQLREQRRKRKEANDAEAED